MSPEIAVTAPLFLKFPRPPFEKGGVKMVLMRSSKVVDLNCDSLLLRIEKITG